jgi:dihydroorotase
MSPSAESTRSKVNKRHAPASEIKEVAIWNADGLVDCATVYLKNGLVEKITPIASSEKPSRVLIPIGVDAQVHLRVLGQTEKAIPETELRAAVAGGYGAVLSMPNTRPVIDTVETLKQALAELASAEARYGVKVLHSAAITMGQLGNELVDFEALASAGIAAFTDDGRGVESNQLMEQAFEHLEKLGLPLLQHAEMPGHGGILAPGPVQEQLGVRPYFEEAEVDMVERDLAALEKFPKARYHVLHVSSRGCLPLIEKARKNGLKVTAEVSPHHLWFSVDEINPTNSSFKMNPPIRSNEDRVGLQKALAEGKIDFVATDHAPHEAPAKGEDFSRAAFGTLGLETALPVLMELYLDKKLTAQRVVQVFAERPARFLGLDQSWGAIRVGQPFRAVLVDLNQSGPAWNEGSFESQSQNSAFHGVRFRTSIVEVFNDAGHWTVGK